MQGVGVQVNVEKSGVMHIRRRGVKRTAETFWGRPILFSEIGFCVASCSYIYI